MSDEVRSKLEDSAAKLKQALMLVCYARPVLTCLAATSALLIELAHLAREMGIDEKTIDRTIKNAEVMTTRGERRMRTYRVCAVTIVMDETDEHREKRKSDEAGRGRKR